MGLDIKILHRMWTFVETSNPYSILKLSDPELIQNLLRQVENISALAPEDRQILQKYIASRTPLIRELAYSRVF